MLTNASSTAPQQQRQQFAEQLYRALRQRATIEPLTSQYPTLTIEDAYHISLIALGLRKNDGECIIGKKIGVTSKAVQNMLGVHQPDAVAGHRQPVAQGNGGAKAITKEKETSTGQTAAWPDNRLRSAQ